MKQSVKVIIWAAVMILLLGGAYLGYRVLNADYEPNSASSQTASSKTKSEPVADFTVIDADGNSVSLSSKFGKPIVLNFWATWCDPCKDELPHFNKVSSELGDQVQFFMVNVDGPGTEADVKTFLTNNGYTFPVYYDTEYNGVKAYGVTGIPISFFINADGKIVASYYGSLSEETLREKINQITD